MAEGPRCSWTKDPPCSRPLEWGSCAEAARPSASPEQTGEASGNSLDDPTVNRLFGRLRWADHLRSGARHQPGHHGETSSVLKIQKLAGCAGAPVVGRLRWENQLNPGAEVATHSLNASPVFKNEFYRHKIRVCKSLTDSSKNVIDNFQELLLCKGKHRGVKDGRGWWREGVPSHGLHGLLECYASPASRSHTRHHSSASREPLQRAEQALLIMKIPFSCRKRGQGERGHRSATKSGLLLAKGRVVERQGREEEWEGASSGPTGPTPVVWISKRTGHTTAKHRARNSSKNSTSVSSCPRQNGHQTARRPPPGCSFSLRAAARTSRTIRSPARLPLRSQPGTEKSAGSGGCEEAAHSTGCRSTQHTHHLLLWTQTKHAGL
ncbi:hypothetical protein AAY473_035893 [Plecturocebus cupreus]